MYFAVDGRQAFASTGDKSLDSRLPAVIFLHGSGLDHTFWGSHPRFFAARKYAVLVPDFPGHTNSDGPALATIEESADWGMDRMIIPAFMYLGNPAEKMAGIAEVIAKHS